MNFPAHSINTKEPSSKFNTDTLTTLKLVKKYHPSFVTTFIINRQEAHCLTGEDLRRCENMITLKKKKEINAKYSGLLKSKVKSASYDIRSKKKSSGKGSARGDRPKTPRHGSAKSQLKSERKEMKSIDLQSGQGKLSIEDCNAKNLDVMEIFKSNVYSNFSASTLNSTKCPNDPLPTPKDIIQKSGSKIKSFWNLPKSPDPENHRRTKLRCDDKKSDVNCGRITVTLKSKTDNADSHSQKAQTNTLKISRRSCFSLIDISNTNECKIVYKNCFLCNKKKDFKVLSNKFNSLKSRYGYTMKPETVVERQFMSASLLESRLLIGFASVQFPIHKMEKATVEHIIDETFTAHESYVRNVLRNYLANAICIFIRYLVTLADRKETDERIDKSLRSNSFYRIVSTCFGMFLSFLIIYVMYTKFAPAFVVK